MLAFCPQPLRLGSTICVPLFRTLFAVALLQSASSIASADALDDLEAMTPTSVRLYGETPLAPIEAVAQQAEHNAAQQLALPPGAAPAVVLSSLEKVLAAKARVDKLLEQSFVVRTEFSKQPDNPELRGALRSWLAITTKLIDLSGRLQYLLYDASNEAVADLAFDPDQTRRLIELFAKYKTGVGALAAAPLLFDAPAGEPEAPPPLPLDLKLKLLGLIRDAGQVELLDELADLVRDAASPSALRLAAAQTIEALGVPQNPRPGQDPTLPKVEITAAELHKALGSVDKKTLSAAQQADFGKLLARLDCQAKNGVEGDSYRLGSFDVQAGDWLLMRNPSPYNLFTELTPGLFTHVGVVAEETGSDGQRRFVIVDLPEKGDRMPATNVETFVKRTRHFVFLRHPDPAAAKKMGEVAGAVIGNPTQFDLNFRTGRVTELRGKPLAGEKINTYCAGFLLLCAQETNKARKEFFPYVEAAAPGLTKDNLAKLGLSFGNDFVSPTGALFSPQLEVVGQRAPIYDPRREVEERVFNHFAQQMQARPLSDAATTFQSMRTGLAQASKTNPLLAQALARAAGVSPEIDLVAAAKTAAVVETLDEIAYASSGDFLAARDAIRSGSPEELKQAGKTPAELRKIEALRQEHAALVGRWQARSLSPRALRTALVEYYVKRGQQQLDARFFTAGPTPAKSK
jgi:hypothetical protein